MCIRFPRSLCSNIHIENFEPYDIGVAYKYYPPAMRRILDCIAAIQQCIAYNIAASKSTNAILQADTVDSIISYMSQYPDDIKQQLTTLHKYHRKATRALEEAREFLFDKCTRQITDTVYNTVEFYFIRDDNPTWFTTPCHWNQMTIP